MDTPNVPSPPEWRLSPLLSGAVQPNVASSSPAPSNGYLYPVHIMNESVSTSSVSPWDGAPCEASMCERLTHEIVRCGSTTASLFHASIAKSSSNPPLADVLQDASNSIRFNAKWFAPTPLALLLRTALAVAMRSSSTVDLYRTLDLIDTIGTYSLLPELLAPARFIAYAYYQGTRSNRHKKLSQHAWTVAEHILDSHLGNEFTSTLLEIISSKEHLHSKSSFSATVGAMILTTQKMLNIGHTEEPRISPTQVLLGLRHASVDKNAILREQTAFLLGAMLSSDRITTELDRDGSLDVCLELIQHCVHQSLDDEAREALFQGVESQLHKFEPYRLPAIARLFVDISRPLPIALSKELLRPWQQASVVGSCDMWNDDSRALLERLSSSTLYIAELVDFIHLSASTILQSKITHVQRDFVSTLEILVSDPQTCLPVRDVLAGAIIQAFVWNVRHANEHATSKWLFLVLCRLALHCPGAADVLLRIRVDASGQGYMDTAQHSEGIAFDREHLNASFDIHNVTSLPLERWTVALHSVIIKDVARWEVYDVYLTWLAPQLRNHAFWRDRSEHINVLRQVLCQRLNGEAFMEPPAETGLGKSYVVAELVQMLTASVSFHNQLLRNDIKAAILTFIGVAGSREPAVSIHCIHALTICCYELPELMAGYMDAIINKMSKMVTQRYLALYVLEFLAGLSRLPALHDKLRQGDFKRIFGVCHSYLQSIRNASMAERKQTPTSERSAPSTTSTTEETAQYVYALAHHVITFWYMALKKENRQGLKEYITGCLKYDSLDGIEHIEDQGLVTIDLMDRVDAEEHITIPTTRPFDTNDGRILVRHRVTGLLLITTETALRTGKTLVTIRRPSGTAQRLVSSRPRKGDSISSRTVDSAMAMVTVESDSHDQFSIIPEDITGRTYGKVAVPRPSSALGSQDILTLPENDESVSRAIQAFDRTPALDSHKAGVIYIGEGQSTEQEILLNQAGSPDYRDFLDDLGTLRKLKNAAFNTQGLDRHDNSDGEFTVVWNNEVTELVYHITTLMPSDPHGDHHATVVNKKKHIGNDFVNIVFHNAAGAPFRFDTFPSAFNYVYIVITPSDRTSFVQARTLAAAPRSSISGSSNNSTSGISNSASSDAQKQQRFYNVHVRTRPGYPNLSSASEPKVISAACLGGYVRNLALNACVFSAMWSAGGGSGAGGGSAGGEYPSSWRQRLHMIRRLHTRFSRPSTAVS